MSSYNQTKLEIRANTAKRLVLTSINSSSVSQHPVCEYEQKHQRIHQGYF